MTAMLLFLPEMLAVGYTAWKSSCPGYSGQEDTWDPPPRTAFGGPWSFISMIQSHMTSVATGDPRLRQSFIINYLML